MEPSRGSLSSVSLDIDSSEGASEHDSTRKSGNGADATIARLLGRGLCNSDAHPNETEGVVSPSADSSQRWVLHACDDLVQELQHLDFDELWRHLPVPQQSATQT